MMSLAAAIVMGFVVLCTADITVMMMAEGQAHQEMMMSPTCMSHCSYICMASPGKVETCVNLLHMTNNTIPSWPDMAACPAETKVINDCFMNCGCQCTRCSMCLMKNMDPMAVRDACQASPEAMKCVMDKRMEALKKCN